jgi:hypothetical protein
VAVAADAGRVGHVAEAAAALAVVESVAAALDDRAAVEAPAVDDEDVGRPSRS